MGELTQFRPASAGLPPSPTLVGVADYFLRTYGPDRVYFTVVPFDELGHEANAGTFALDNIDHLRPWLIVQMAKLASRRVAVVAMVVRVFSKTRSIEVLGPRGRIRIPEKDMYMFHFSADGCVGIDGDEAALAHTTDAASGEPVPAEPGLHFRSGIDVVDAIKAGS